MILQLPRSPFHPHVDIPGPQLVQHLIQALLAGGRAAGPGDPTDVIILLAERAEMLSVHEAAALERITDKIG